MWLTTPKEYQDHLKQIQIDFVFQEMVKSLGLSSELLKPDNSNYTSAKLDFETFKKQIES